MSKIGLNLASPLNPIATLFPSSMLLELLHLFFLLKVGTAGLFMAMYLKYVTNRQDILIPIFATCFALCAYTLGFYSNIMFFDTFAMTPLVMLGTHKLIRESKYATYIIALALAVIFNSITAFHTSLFVAAYFFVACFIEKCAIRESLKKFIAIGICTLIAIGLTAFVTLPTAASVMAAPRTGAPFPRNIAFYDPFLNLIADFLAFRPPSITFGSPNIYSGMISIVLLPMFLVSKKISRREKIGLTSLLLFLVISTNVNVLTFIWHGFVNPVGFAPRFSFLVSFVLVWIAYRTYVSLEEDLKRLHLIAAAAFLLVFFALARLGEQNTAYLLWNILLAAAYLVLFAIWAQSKKIVRTGTRLIRILKCTLLLIVVIELSFTSYLAVRNQGTEPRSETFHYDQVIAVLAERDIGENDFFRTEFTRAGANGTLLYASAGHLHRLSIFSSQAHADVTNFMLSLGLAGIRELNQYQYFETSPLTNTFLSVRYLVERTDNPAGQGHFWERVYQEGITVLLRNRYDLPIAFMVNEQLATWEPNIQTQLDSQNRFFRQASGMEEDLFNIYTTHAHSADGIFRFYYTMPEDGDLFFHAPGAYNIFMSADDRPLTYITSTLGHMGWAPTSSIPYIAHAGAFAAGETIILEITFPAPGDRYIDFGLINRELFAEAHAVWADQAIELTHFSDTRITGRVNASEYGLLYSSIPHVGNWSVFVNGEQRDVVLIGNAMTGVFLEVGEHIVEFRYVNTSFIMGSIISAASLTIFLAFYGIRWAKRYSNRGTVPKPRPKNE